MKAIVFDDFGSADVLRLADVPMPEVRPDDLLVKVMAAGVNRADLLQREGVYGSQRYGDMGSSVVAHMLNMPASTAAWRWSFRPACRSRRQLPSWRAS